MSHDARRAPGARPNRLAGESSPYLLQHAHNPVEWWPWCPGAFAEAVRRDVPIFLSVGYSTCYWCHVMERESFEDPETAKLMNELFVCVKLDREERPDVDELYMASVQMLTGHGGWPMSVFLEPGTLRPFWGGTYFPPKPAHNLPSFRQVLEGMSQAFKDRRADVATQANSIAQAVAEKLGGSSGRAVHVGKPQVGMAVQTLLTILDRSHGGFGDAPKFPQPVYLELLLDARERTPDPDARAAVDAALKLTLDRMALGGIHDHVGGGFHRYSVDRAWIVPHFEKMLYDQAQLLRVYARAARVLDDPFYARVAARTVAYAAREMLGPCGFYSAQDAEVAGREGLNYVWTRAEFSAVLGDDARFARSLYALDDGPNFRDTHHPDAPAVNVLRMAEHPARTATRLGLDLPAFWSRVDWCNEQLSVARSRRPQPRRDDKVIASWNGLMLAALAEAVGSDPRTMALLPTDFPARLRAMLALLGAPVGGASDPALLRSALDRPGPQPSGTPAPPATLEDYAALASGLFAWSRHDPNPDELSGTAHRLCAAATERFCGADGEFFDAAAGREDLFVRPRSTYDGAMPCGTSLMAHAFLDAADHRPGAPSSLVNAARAVASVSAAMAESPVSTANATRALLRFTGSREAVLVEALAKAGAGPLAKPAPRPAAAGKSNATGANGSEPVQVFVSQSTVELAPDQPAEFFIRLSIAPGHHVYAADLGNAAGPQGGGPQGLVPLRIGIVGGGGVTAFADYPPGEPLGQTNPDGPAAAVPLVYRGDVAFPVALERTGDWVGEPKLAVNVQVCTDRACLAPMTLELDVELRPA